MPAESADDPSLVAGADLVQEACAIKCWLLNCLKDVEGPITMGTYLYADGQANVTLTAAADAIIKIAAEKLGKDRISFAWLGSPATAHVMTAECAAAQAANVQDKVPVGSQKEREPVDFGSEKAHVYRGYSLFQGPNYALAQHMRHWRAMVLEDAGFTVSTPMAPACRTESVCHVELMVKLLDGMAYFPPCEAFDSDAANALLFGMLIADLAAPQQAALPSPFHIFTRRSFHGGYWRVPYNMESCGKTGYLLGKFFPQKYV